MRYGDMPGRGDMTCSAFGEEHGVYSASSGDYFWADDRDEVTCSECGEPMLLVRHVNYWEPVGEGEGR